MSTPNWSELPQRVRDGLTAGRVAVRNWWTAVREDPAHLREGPVLRIAAWLLLGCAAFATAWWLTGAFPVWLPKPGGGEPAPTAILRLACASNECGAVFMAELPRNFVAWPAKCQDCGGQTAQRAGNCRTCRGWFADTPQADGLCRKCLAALEAAKRVKPTTSAPTDPDDAEDGWR